MFESTSAELPPTTQLVRSFSDDLQKRTPGDALARGLVAKVAVDKQRETNRAALQSQWNSFLLEGRDLALSTVQDEEAILLDQSRRLYQAWTSFCKRLPDKQRKEASEQVPTLRLLYESVSQASTTWKEKREGTKSGRLKRIFTRLCENVESHSNLVSMLPTENSYVTLLTGSLTAIAQASINHQELADGVSSTLEDLSQDMNYWNELIKQYSNMEVLQRYIRELYIVIFEFLAEIFTQWSKSSWQRFRTSFDEQAIRNLFTEKRNRIKAIEQRMERYTRLEFERKTQKLHDEARNSQVQMALDLEKMNRDQSFYLPLLLQLGTCVNRLLAQNAGRSFPDVEERQLHALLSDTSEFRATIASSESDETTNISPEPLQALEPEAENQGHTLKGHTAASPEHFSKQQILELLGPITTKYGRDMQLIVETALRASRVHIYDGTKRRIDSWTTNTHSDKLWIQGLHEVSHPSQNTLTSVGLVALANNSRIPCLSYFCSLGVYDSPETSSMSCEEMLRDLLKSLIVQLLLMLPNDIETTMPNLSTRRFERLLDPHFNVEEAVLLFRDLRGLGPSYMHCVIDAIQELEDRSDSAHTKNLLRVLREIANPFGGSDKHSLLGSDESKVVKICFVSDGYTDVLAELAQYGHIEKVEPNDEFSEPPDEDGRGLVISWQSEDDL
ncbi:hypothetical protein F5Y10DRAFT_233646 [Nemania abortiva]|nr:hypothetical protein F5Y10DRAFT_233646 [Nemania abortiva]